ncbi:reverse transcriptase [Gossypium australe]|uniref:Reverse transcriptase n=1 Tax=Gossypium australe TaxID=47621 RepID=A0A5B6VQ27_9ROSI|nr:reverse transcriptase [Gossypium australe]
MLGIEIDAAFETFKKKSRRGQGNVRGNAGANNRAKSRKELRSSRFTVLKEVRETSDNHALFAGGFLSVKGAEIDPGEVDGFNTRVGDKSLRGLGSISVLGFKPSSGIGSSKEAAAVAQEMDDVRHPIVGLAMEPATLNSSGQAANGRHKKAMEKRPMLGSVITQKMSEELNIGNFISNSNSNAGVAGSSHHLSSGKDVVLDDVVRGGLSTEVRGDLNAWNFNNIKAHFDPTFEGSGGTLVPISDGVLDPGKHSAISFKDLSHKKEKSSSVNLSCGKLGEGIFVFKERHGGKDSIGRSSRKASNASRGRGSRSKTSGNSRVSLAESIEEMAKLISNLNLSNDFISRSEGVDLITDGDTVSRQVVPVISFLVFFGNIIGNIVLILLVCLKTRVSGFNVDNIIAKLGFLNSHHVEAIGFLEGIWIGWKNSVCLEIIYNHYQFIMAQVGSTSSPISVFISFVYGSLNRQKSKDLWDILKSLIPMGNCPWVVIGDFNAILSSSEKSGGMSKGRLCPLFGDFVDKAELHDLGFRGPPFTWHGRLDRALGNEAWVQLFPNILVTDLSKFKSDHRPLLLSLNPEAILPKGMPFRFSAGWVKHSNFGKFVEDN